jgi:PAS domain S-box-containing protein
MPKTSLAWLVRYGMALLAVALATASQLALDPLLGGRFPFLAFFVAIGLTTWYGGIWPSLLAVVLSWLAVDHFLLEPRGPGPIVWDKSQLIFPFFAVGLTITLLSEAARDARSRARVSAVEAQRARDAQQVQREWFRITLASIGDAVITTDPEGRVISLNPAAERLTGSGGPEAAGRPLTEVFPTLEGSILGAGHSHSPIAGVIRGQAVISGHQTALIDGGGATRYVEHNAAPIRDDRGEVTGAVIVLRDITERRQAEQALRKSEARFRHLADTMPQIVWTATPDGSVDYFNARWYEYTGLTSEASLHEGWRAAVHNDDQGRFSSVRDPGVGAGREFEAELRLRRRDGAYRWHLVRSVPVPDEAGDLARRYGAATDIDDRKRAEEALRESERQYRAFYDQAAVGIAEVDLTGRFLRANDRYCEMVGYPQQELLGLRFQDITHPEDPPGNLEQFARIVAGPSMSSYTIEKRYVRKDGRVVWGRMAAALIRDGAGRPERVVAVVEDITERVRAEEALRVSEEQFRGLAEGMPHCVWMCDAQGQNLYQNRVWYDYTGTPPGSGHGQEWLDPYHPDDRPRLIEEWTETLRTGGAHAYDLEARIRRRDGVYHWFRVKGSPIRDCGRAVRWVGTCTDIHEQRRLVDALRDADRRKDEFLAMLAHELRNPLAPIGNAVTVMALAEDDREGQRWSREVIHRQVRHLSSLVDDLLDVGRITQGKITLTRAPLAVETFLGAAVEASRPLIDARKHELEVALPEEGLQVEGDATRLAQVISNLLNNAAKYTPECGHIGLSIGRDRDREEAVIRVKDDGEGIAPEMLPRVFDLFSQASRSIARSEGGLGIGLTLVKRLVEMHDGTVEARSDGPGKGSEFVVRLPLLRSQVPAPPLPPPSPSPSPGGEAPTPVPVPVPVRPRRILVVDDSRDSADTLARLLRRLGHAVEVAYEGPSACAAAVALLPDIVLLDIGLPGMDGYAVARRLRAEPALNGVCLVALTGYGSAADRRKSAESGFDAHLVKPVEFDALRRMLEAVQAPTPPGDPPKSHQPST